MANYIRVHSLAKELGIAAKELIEILRREGVTVSSHLSGIDQDLAELIKEHIKDEQKKVSEKSQEEKTLEQTENRTLSKQKNAPVIAKDAVPVSADDTPSASEETVPVETVPVEIHLSSPIKVKDLASSLDVKPYELIHKLLNMNVFASINDNIEAPVAVDICTQYNHTLIVDKREKPAATGKEIRQKDVPPEEIVYENESTTARPPIVAFLGHVDHGKTSLLDRARNTKVTSGEAGGITQHIGASTIKWKGQRITFIDTPGHQAFTAMRSRGANVTDIVVLVVAADDGMMPQTIEAFEHAKAAGVSIIVVLNKMDLPAADPLRVMTQMQQHGLELEEWGGEIGVIQASAATGKGVDDLLERIILEAEMLELRANPDLPVKAVVLESQLEQGLGATVNVLVKNGTISVGDRIICDKFSGKVKALINNHKKRVKSVGPGYAVTVVGLSGVPDGGLVLVGCKDERQAKKLASDRETKTRERQLQHERHTTVHDLFIQIEEQTKKELRIILKADTYGTSEAVIHMLEKLDSPKVKVNIVSSGIGAITDNDVLLASASNASLVGFHVRANPSIHTLAKREGVNILLYSIIYELVDQITETMEGMLDPIIREEIVGKAEILQVFSPSKGRKICGCSVSKGLVRIGIHARVYRQNEIIYNGTVASLRRFTEDVKVVKQGFECGIRLDNFDDFETGDQIEIYDYKKIMEKGSLQLSTS